MFQGSSTNAAQHADLAQVPSVPTDKGRNTTTLEEEGRLREDDARQQLDESPQEKPPEDVPPDGGYGWVCVACAAFINANTWGVNSSYGVFLSHYLENDIFPGMTPIAYAFTGGLSMSCCLLISPLVTHAIHLYGNRAVINVGVVLQTLSFIGASFASKSWQLFLSQGVCFGFGMGFIFIASVSILPQWFLHKRSVANSLAAAGSGLGGLAYSLGTGAMIPNLGLGWTFRVLGLVTFAVNLVASNLMRDRNKAVGSRYRAFHFPLLKRPEFLLLQAWGILSLLGYVVLLFSMPNFARTIGLSQKQGSIVGALLNLGQGLGRPVVGLISDRYGRINMGAFFSFLCGVFCISVWIPAMNMGVTCFFAIIVGTVAGTFWTTIVPICAEVIGLQELPSGLSITWVTMVPPTTVSEPIGLLLRDESKSNWVYLHAQIFTALVYIVGAFCLWLIRGWKVGDNERIAREKAIAMAAEASGSVLNPANNATCDETKGALQTQESPVASSSVPPVGPAISPWSAKHLFRRMIAPVRV
ncbi:hypothetical protein VTO42DRAFT_7903 [Malbranchea cinnamomea]